MLKKTLLIALCLGLLHACKHSTPGEVRNYNVLFISVDDLRPELGCYGKDYIHSPHIDQLAASAFLFEQAYCQVPVCGASRASLLTGLLPTANRFLAYDARMDADAPDVTTLPMHFKNQGYYTLNYGKVSHFPDDQQDSWSEEPLRPDWHKLADGSWSWEGWHDYQTESNPHLDRTHPKRAGLPYESAHVPDSAYADGQTIQMAIRKLSQLKELDQPFFFGVGLLKPHLPFNAPQKYWDLYKREDIVLAPNPFSPSGAPEEAIPNWGELRAYAGVPSTGPVEDSMAISLLHGYYACVSYVDALIGALLHELERLDLDKNTMVVLWSDHGWFLGEHGFWCKHSLYELATRVPLLIKIPGSENPRRVNTMVELMDLYPTLCEINGLQLPEHLQGKSFARVFTQEDYSHKSYVYSRYFEGESMKKDGFRYTAYFDKTNALKGEMLFNHQSDSLENVNVASDPLYRERKANFQSILSRIRTH